MSNRTIELTESLYDYMLSISLRESEILRQLREETAKHEQKAMQISPEQGQFMAFLIRLMGARRILEIGVFTGYSSLCMALALPEEGEIVACDIDEGYTSIARRYWKDAAVANKIKLHLAPALETLENLLNNGQENSFDFAFIDANKENYQSYYEYCLKLLRPGGAVAIDNVFWDGKVIDPSIKDPDTQAIRNLNQKLAADDRVHLTLVPIGDGLTLAQKI